MRLGSLARAAALLVAATLAAGALTGCGAASSDAEQSADAVVAAPPAPGKAIFDDPSGWTVHRDDGEFTQRYRIVDREIYCESKTLARGTVADALQLLRDPWTWYGGAVEDWEPTADGGRHYRLWPVGKLALVNVTEEMAAPVRLENGGVRVVIELGGYASGTAYVELHPRGDGELEIVGRFAGVRSNVLPTALFTLSHLGAEGGMVLGIHTHGGFAGLKDALAAASGG